MLRRSDFKPKIISLFGDIRYLFQCLFLFFRKTNKVNLLFLGYGVHWDIIIERANPTRSGLRLNLERGQHDVIEFDGFAVDPAIAVVELETV